MVRLATSATGRQFLPLVLVIATRALSTTDEMAQAAGTHSATSPSCRSPPPNARIMIRQNAPSPAHAGGRALKHGEPIASPGYRASQFGFPSAYYDSAHRLIAIPLNNGVTAETTVTPHTAIYRLTYQPGTDQMVLLDITSDLGKSFHGGKVPFTPSLTAGGTMRATYYQTGEYTSFSLAGTFERELRGEGRAKADVIMGFESGMGMEKGKGKNMKVASTVRMVVSWISTDKACSYAEEEGSMRAQWYAVRSTVDVNATGVSAAAQELFWKSLYRTYMAPTNITGDNPSGKPYWDDFYCIWDTFRVVHPLYVITAPAAQPEIGFTQGGSNADTLLSDSFVKGIGMEFEGKVDSEKGLEVMIKDATVVGDFEGEGRGGINFRKKLGYVPVRDNDHPHSTGANTRRGPFPLHYQSAYLFLLLALYLSPTMFHSITHPHSSASCLLDYAHEISTLAHDVRPTVLNAIDITSGIKPPSYKTMQCYNP
ncbi:hypothetical protein B0H19DRAFT_1272872 [Mycena capillaripes]|nr:hypothetical protein B0H19DRAFT_1272872 [Mycena capillaripes]